MSDHALEVQNPMGLAPVGYVEQNVSMMTQLATAQIQSRYQMAMRFPRNMDQVRQDMLKECARPSFCMPDESKNGSSIALYRVPRGRVKDANGNWVQNNIEGVSIRFAEMCLRAYKNMSIDVVPLGEDEDQRLFQVNCTDYEANNTTSEMVNVPKSVERKKAGDAEIISRRSNSYGDEVFIVKATEEELMMKRNAAVSKARRNLIMQNIPGWLVEECVNAIRETARKKDAQDPDAAKKKLFDAFAGIGISAEQLTKYLGHTNQQLSPAELEDLRGYYSGIKEGVTTWKDIVQAKEEGGDEDQAKRVDALFQTLGYTVQQVRSTKAKYVGHTDKLLAWLEGEAKKKQNNGGAPAQAQQQAAAVAEDLKQAGDVAEKELNRMADSGLPTDPAPAQKKAAAPPKKQTPVPAGW